MKNDTKTSSYGLFFYKERYFSYPSPLLLSLTLIKGHLNTTIQFGYVTCIGPSTKLFLPKTQALRPKPPRKFEKKKTHKKIVP